MPALVLIVVLWLAAPARAAWMDPAPDAATGATFALWLAEFRSEASGRGFGEALLARTLDGLEPLPGVLARDHAQPEARLTFDAYARRRITRDVVRRGAAALRAHAEVLGRVAQAFGVPPRIVVAVWGLESHFGEHRGDVPVVASLATLAWNGRRGGLFRAQLFDALTMVERGDVDAADLRGSWAGAMGQPQFLPSSYLAYAVDFDGDGRRDIWTSVADTFASIANYLRRHGWEGNDWGREVRVPPRLREMEKDATRAEGCRAMHHMTAELPLSEWRRRGATRTDAAALPDVARPARLVTAGARAFLVHESYDALLRYNCAHHYALAVALLADRLR